MKHRNKKYGLTLVEMLIAMTILSFLGAVVYTTFSQGMSLWHRAAKDHPETDVEIFFEKLTHDLRSAIVSERVHFKGVQDQLDFFTRVTAQEVNPRESGTGLVPVQVHYAFVKSRKAVTKSQESLKQVLSPLLDAPSADERTLIGQVSGCAIEYYDDDGRDNAYLWKTRWEKDCLPLAVKVDLDYRVGSDTRKYSRIVPVLAGGCSNKT